MLSTDLMHHLRKAAVCTPIALPVERTECELVRLRAAMEVLADFDTH